MLLLACLYNPFERFLQQWLVQRLFQGFMMMLLLFDSTCNQAILYEQHLTPQKPEAVAMLLLACLYNPFERFLQQWLVQHLFQGFMMMLLLFDSTCNQARLRSCAPDTPEAKSSGNAAAGMFVQPI